MTTSPIQFLSSVKWGTAIVTYSYRVVATKEYMATPATIPSSALLTLSEYWKGVKG